jgi:hypothetical protein
MVVELLRHLISQVALDHAAPYRRHQPGVVPLVLIGITSREADYGLREAVAFAHVCVDGYRIA